MRFVNIINVTTDDFSKPNNLKSQIDFVYDNKNYNCKCSQFDNFVFNVYNKNKNLVLCSNYNLNGENIVMNKK